MSWLDDAKKKRQQAEQAQKEVARRSVESEKKSLEARKNFWKQHKKEIYSISKDIAKVVYEPTWLGGFKGGIVEMANQPFYLNIDQPTVASIAPKIVIPNFFLLYKLPRYTNDEEFFVGVSDRNELVFGRFNGNWQRNDGGEDFCPRIHVFIKASSINELKDAIAKQL